jgi:ABC-2 type transport system ATP-binding protein
MPDAAEILMNAIEITHLTKIFKGKKGQKVEALTDLTLEIGQGEVFGFLGPNGAGKSTTIKTLMGQIKPSGGSATIFGISATDAAARLRVGYLPENPAFYDFLTAREYLRFVGNAFAMPQQLVAAESEKVLQLLDLATAADRPIRGYSKGMVQRLGLAQAMLHDPDLYILDEPMSGLDPIGRALVKEIIKDLRHRGKTVFFSTHITADIEVVCDRVGFIVKGRLTSVDSVEDILQRGIVGYVIQAKDANGAIREVEVKQAELKSFMEEIMAAGASLERIEPMRKDLESLFLDIVAQGNNDSR